MPAGSPPTATARWSRGLAALGVLCASLLVYVSNEDNQLVSSVHPAFREMVVRSYNLIATLKGPQHRRHDTRPVEAELAIDSLNDRLESNERAQLAMGVISGTSHLNRLRAIQDTWLQAMDPETDAVVFFAERTDPLGPTVGVNGTGEWERRGAGSACPGRARSDHGNLSFWSWVSSVGGGRGVASSASTLLLSSRRHSSFPLCPFHQRTRGRGLRSAGLGDSRTCTHTSRARLGTCSWMTTPSWRRPT
jgi:hypothetical protein